MVPLTRKEKPLYLRRLSMTLVLLLLAVAVQAWAVPDFTFIHISDVHTGGGDAPLQSHQTIPAIKDLGEITITPYNVTVPKPSFVISTGDLTEFGGARGIWDEYLSNFKDFQIPVYNQFGNHDNTWCAMRFKNRAAYGQDWYSFDQSGCHFVALDTAGLQDPRPYFGQEQLLWLKQDLAKLPLQTPVFLYWHHPLPSSEMASPYDWDRLFDLLRPYNVVLFMDGHGHGPQYRKISGFDRVEGGSTYGPGAPGYNVISVKDNVLRVAYYRVKETDKWQKLLEKPLPVASAYPKITITSPTDRQVITGPLDLHARVLNSEVIQTASMQVDDKEELVTNLTINGTQFTGRFDPTGLTPGAHYARFSFKPAQGDGYQQSVCFYVDSGPVKPAWRAFLGGSSRCTPTVVGNRVYVGANDGTLYAFNAKTGTPVWKFETKAEIMGQPLVVENSIFFGNGDGKLYCLDLQGKQKWVYTASTTTPGAAPWPLYAGPVYADGMVLVGANDGAFYAVDANTGKEYWVNRDARYTIETRPWVENGVVYYSAWDQYVYAVNLADGTLKWKCLGAGSEEAAGAKSYYSPADGTPVLAGGKIWIADRAYKLSVIDAQTGKRVGRRDGVAGVGYAEDRQSVYLRMSAGRLIKVNAIEPPPPPAPVAVPEAPAPEGAVKVEKVEKTKPLAFAGTDLWTADCSLNSIPTSPVEKDGMVYVCSGRGLVSAVNAADGKIAWQYMALPLLYVMSDVSVGNGLAYVSGLDGSLTALPAGAG